MDSHIIDYYNTIPSQINVIDSMNQELEESQKTERKIKGYLRDAYDLIEEMFFDLSTSDIQDEIYNKLFKKSKYIYKCHECNEYVDGAGPCTHAKHYELYLDLKIGKNRLCYECFAEKYEIIDTEEMPGIPGEWHSDGNKVKVNMEMSTTDLYVYILISSLVFIVSKGNKSIKKLIQITCYYEDNIYDLDKYSEEMKKFICEIMGGNIPLLKEIDNHIYGYIHKLVNYCTSEGSPRPLESYEGNSVGFLEDILIIHYENMASRIC